MAGCGPLGLDSETDLEDIKRSIKRMTPVGATEAVVTSRKDLEFKPIINTGFNISNHNWFSLNIATQTAHVPVGPIIRPGKIQLFYTTKV